MSLRTLHLTQKISLWVGTLSRCPFVTIFSWIELKDAENEHQNGLIKEQKGVKIA